MSIGILPFLLPLSSSGPPGEEYECERHNANLGDPSLFTAPFSGTTADSDADRAGARFERSKSEGQDESQVWTAKLEEFEVMGWDELPASRII